MNPSVLIMFYIIRFPGALMREYPDRPIAAVAACILDDDEQVLLIQRGQEPARGKWSFPGGAIRIGETLVDALKREVKEECGIEITGIELLSGASRVIYDDKGLIQYHYVIFDYLCRPDEGQLHASSDADAARWFSMRELEAVALTDGLIEIIQKGIKKAPFKGA